MFFLYYGKQTELLFFNLYYAKQIKRLRCFLIFQNVFFHIIKGLRLLKMLFAISIHLNSEAIGVRQS